MPHSTRLNFEVGGSVMTGYSRSSRIAHVMERAGLGAAGAACGLFVAAHLAHAGVQSISSLEFILTMMAAGAAGFYLGIDLPARRPSADHLLAWQVDSAEMLSAFGTFLAPVAALLSVAYIILDVDARHVWSVVIALGWVLGVTMQISSGAIARFRRRRVSSIESSLSTSSTS